MVPHLLTLDPYDRRFAHLPVIWSLLYELSLLGSLRLPCELLVFLGMEDIHEMC